MITPSQLAASGTEHGHQSAVFCWANNSLDKYPILKYLFAVPNGFYGSSAQKGKMKAEGLKSGVPDIWLPVVKHEPIVGSKNISCGLIIELKVGINKPSQEQLDWLAFLKQQGYLCYICYGWEEARDRIMNYLEG